MTRWDRWRKSPLRTVVDVALAEAQRAFDLARQSGLPDGVRNPAYRQLEIARAWAESAEDEFLQGNEARAAEIAAGISSYGVGRYAESGFLKAVNNQRAAKKPRKPPGEIEACIDAALAKPGTAKERWAHLPRLLEQAGFIVQEVQTDAGQLAIVVDADKPFKLSLKAFQNQLTKKKSRQPG